MKRNPTADRQDSHIPGEPGIWFFVIGDLLVFSTFFATYFFYRAGDPELYARSQAQLSSGFGVANTIILLTSSWLVARAVLAVRHNETAKATILLRAALLCGLIFVVNKAVEWGDKISAGVTVSSNEFFMFYYMFTGIHLLHVLAGMGFLYFSSTLTALPNRDHLIIQRPIEVGATFWHVVDLLWIVIFAIMYLVH